MDFLNLAKKRCSIRNYQSKSIEREKLDKILQAGRVAPTAANKQPQRILVIESPLGFEKLKKACNPYNAPLAFVVCADRCACWKRPIDGKLTDDIDASIVTTHMMLEAADLGLDSVWICYFDPKIIKSEFSLPETCEPVNILCVGYAQGEVKSPERHASERKPLEELVFFEKF